MSLPMPFLGLLLLLLLLLQTFSIGSARSPSPPMTEPFTPLHGYNSTALPPALHSPDPLVRFTWREDVDPNRMQSYISIEPISAESNPVQSFSNLKSLTSSTEATYIKVQGNGSLMLDFGVERASWLEFESPDLEALLENGAEISVQG